MSTMLKHFVLNLRLPETFLFFLPLRIGCLMIPAVYTCFRVLKIQRKISKTNSGQLDEQLDCVFKVFWDAICICLNSALFAGAWRRSECLMFVGSLANFLHCVGYVMYRLEYASTHCTEAGEYVAMVAASVWDAYALIVQYSYLKDLQEEEKGRSYCNRRRGAVSE